MGFVGQRPWAKRPVYHASAPIYLGNSLPPFAEAANILESHSRFRSPFLADHFQYHRF
ncbi:hypothetical protein Pr1d_22050 [Bythopirellula goksoeyrii]|uniref:Uncharacterized protein n=1 Tax=Bythopirellula goksoeyrii TaxID=1400387 RepID=A0A5B9Q7E4_9BACT|nr:hypothetical protein Pr1d_22050 [Bythopirellula goksoeyrii]